MEISWIINCENLHVVDKPSHENIMSLSSYKPIIYILERLVYLFCFPD